MNFNTTSQIINGQRKTILVVETDEPFQPENANIVRQTIESGNETTYIDWYNAQTAFYKQNLERNEKYYNWMIVDHKEETSAIPESSYIELQQQITDADIAYIKAQQQITELQIQLGV